jgi:hypothetical protein
VTGYFLISPYPDIKCLGYQRNRHSLVPITMAGVLRLLAFCLLVAETIHSLPTHSHAHAHPKPSEHFPKHVVLDSEGKYHLFWKFNSTHITFEAHVKTRGYIGLGLSPNGKMYPADIVVGMVSHGHAYFEVSLIKENGGILTLNEAKFR